MPRVETLPPISGTAPRRNTRSRKPPPQQDRLSQRALFFRRVRKSLKPGLWVFALGSVVYVAAALVRALPASTPASAPQQPAPAARHGFGLAGLAADLGLRIEAVQVHGAVTVDPSQLAAAIGVKPGDPALGFSLAVVRNRVAQLGPVQDVTVERVLPDTLIVSITERDALAIWQTTSNGIASFVLIDKKGNAIADQDAAAAKRRQPSLLLLSGADAPQFASTLINELQTAPVVLTHVAAAERVDGLRWNLILKNQTLVKLPDDGEAEAIGQLAALQDSVQLLDRPVQDIDLRQPGRLVVRPYVIAAPPGTKTSGPKTEPAHE